ncbi:MAG: hypothetical protein KBC33_02000, partial [Candidatus Pacebacteria bacterium]|nr:hypothetical protein [Candidatus Paceibacterota bacterium]
MKKQEEQRIEIAARVGQIRPHTVDLKLFDMDEDYRIYIFLRGKDMICFDEIGLSALAQLVMNRLESARSVFRLYPQLLKPKSFEQAVMGSYGYQLSKEVKLPNVLSVGSIGVYFAFGPREFNPSITPTPPRGFKRYEGMCVVGSDAGFHLWLPKSNELVVLDLELMEYLLKKDRMIGWYCLHCIKDVFVRLSHDFDMIRATLTVFNDE